MSYSFLKVLEVRLVKISDFFNSQIHILAIRNGIITVIPLTIIGSIFLIIGSPPFDPSTMTNDGIFFFLLNVWYEFASEYSDLLLTPYRVTMGIMAIFVALSISYNLAKSYKLDAFNISIASAVTFILVSAPISSEKISITYLGSKGIIMAIFISIISVELMRFFYMKGFTFQMPDGVLKPLVSSFEILLPFLFNIIVVYGVALFLEIVTGKILPELLYSIMTPVINGTDSPFFIGPLMLAENFLWSLGVHTTTVTGPIRNVIGLSNLSANSLAHVMGQPLPFVFTRSFNFSYLTIGGAGSTFPLVLLLMKSKSKELKTVGKMGFIPSIFNINDPIIFGIPIFLNPIMIFPFVVVPVVNTFLGFWATNTGIINAAIADIPWTSPAIIGAFISTLDWRASVFVLVLLGIDSVIYYPFYKVYETRILQREVVNNLIY